MPNLEPTALVIIATTVVMSLIGLLDDLRSLPAFVRLGAQVCGAAVVVASGGDRLIESWNPVRNHTWIAIPAAVLWIVWMTNANNFMDGIDGLAGGQAVIAATAISVIAFATGARSAGMLALGMGAAAAGFLVLNFPRGSIFMGDGGSTMIGFFVGSLPFLPGRRTVSVECVALAMALFLLDTSTTLARRVLRRERLFDAHRTHWFQRPLACGIGHRVITLAAYPGMILVAVGAVAYARAGLVARTLLICGALGVFLGYAAIVVALESRHRANAPSPVASTRDMDVGVSGS